MKNLYSLNIYILKYKKLLIFGIIFILISNIFALYPAEFVKEAFDRIEEQSKNNQNQEIHKTLLKYSFLIILFAILKGLFTYLMRQTIIVMSRKIEFDLKNNIFNKYQKLSLAFYKKNSTGDLMNRITEDVSRVRMYLGPAIMYIISLIILFALVIWKMTIESPTLTIYVLTPLPILAITVYYVSHHINKNSEKVQQQLSDITSMSQESFSAIKLIKSFKNENHSVKSFLNYCTTYTKKQLQLVSIEAWFFPLIILLVGTSTVVTIYIGGKLSIEGDITNGNIAQFIIYINMLTWPVASIGWATSLIQRAEASMSRINEFLKQDCEIYNNKKISNPENNNILFKNVFFKYPDTGIQALKNISFEIKENQTLGIFGRTGSGKSTVAHLITRIYDRDSGKVLIGNKDINKIDLKYLREKIGYVPQDGFLFSGTIFENISFGQDKKSIDQVIEVAKIAEITDEIDRFKNKYNTVIGERGVQLSGGQRQRISIARAIYINPDIYIFDDCLSAIDANKEKLILQNIKNKTKAKTNIIISHRTSSLIHADHIIVLDNGEIIEEGNHDNLIQKNGFYSKIHKKQITSKKSHK